MKNHLYYISGMLLAVSQFASAQQTSIIWGPLSNDVAMSIMTKFDDSSFSVADIKDLSGFIERLRKKTDPVSAFLWQQFTMQVQSVLLNFQPGVSSLNEAQLTVVEALNRLIGEASIYTPERFKGVSFRAATTNIIQQLRVNYLNSFPPGPYAANFNRLLLEDAFPLELSKHIPSDNPIIRIDYPVLLTVAFTNIGTNETFWIASARPIENDREYAFDVMTPSGRKISPKVDFTLIRARLGLPLDSGEFRLRTFTFNLSAICKFNEIGTYTITATRQVDWPGHAPFTVRSNPLTIRIVPDNE